MHIYKVVGYHKLVRVHCFPEFLVENSRENIELPAISSLNTSLSFLHMNQYLWRLRLHEYHYLTFGACFCFCTLICVSSDHTFFLLFLQKGDNHDIGGVWALIHGAGSLCWQG